MGNRGRGGLLAIRHANLDVRRQAKKASIGGQYNEIRLRYILYNDTCNYLESDVKGADTALLHEYRFGFINII